MNRIVFDAAAVIEATACFDLQLWLTADVAGFSLAVIEVAAEAAFVLEMGEAFFDCPVDAQAARLTIPSTQQPQRLPDNRVGAERIQ